MLFAEDKNVPFVLRLAEGRCSSDCRQLVISHVGPECKIQHDPVYEYKESSDTLVDAPISHYCKYLGKGQAGLA